MAEDLSNVSANIPEKTPEVPKGPLGFSPEETPSIALDSETIVELGKPSGAPPEGEVGSFSPPPKKNLLVRPLRTYRDDITKLIQKGGASYLSMATAQYKRQGETGAETTSSKRILFLLIGSIFFIIAGIAGAGYFYFANSTDTPPIIAPTPSALVFAEAKQSINVTGEGRDQLLRTLTNARNTVSQKIGSLTHLALTTDLQTGKKLMTSGEFLQTIGAHLPPSTLRALEETFMFGIYEQSGGQPFLIFKTTSFGESYAGMLAWEPYMRQDLSPLFGQAVGGGAATVGVIGTSTPPASTSSGGDTFVDRVIRNKDTRVLFSGNGAPLIIYSLPDQQTILITTNEGTFAEILNRIATARPR